MQSSTMICFASEMAQRRLQRPSSQNNFPPGKLPPFQHLVSGNGVEMGRGIKTNLVTKGSI